MEIQTLAILFSTLFLALFLVLIYVIARNPKYFLFQFPLDVLKILVKWRSSEDIKAWNEKDDDIEYKAKRKKKVYFQSADKYILAFSTEEQKVKQSIANGVASLEESALSNETYIKSDYALIVKLPKQTDFYLFHYLLQWLDNEGVCNTGFVSGKSTEYVVYQDKSSLNNLIGETESGARFSVSLYEDYIESQYLMLDRNIKLDKLKGFRVISEIIKSTTANKTYSA
ncbi:hypothetical protein [Pontibacter virosus]|uniref:Uncharacterized protein n=1 Tax=Pontibacter virosus TaxID=1765052 RepID=A0A2U1AV10_9BACT|nr:hypothetical protein [Pontibacter virosus]PVY40266.1 hypothetical protein C8E01_108160 [Pontibacter virosus]